MPASALLVSGAEWLRHPPAIPPTQATSTLRDS